MVRTTVTAGDRQGDAEDGQHKAFWTPPDVRDRESDQAPEGVSRCAGRSPVTERLWVRGLHEVGMLSAPCFVERDSRVSAGVTRIRSRLRQGVAAGNGFRRRSVLDARKRCWLLRAVGPNRAARRSWPVGRPNIILIGSPDADRPSGNEIAGSPVTLASGVKATAFGELVDDLLIVRRSGPDARRVGVTSARVGVSSTSY